MEKAIKFRNQQQMKFMMKINSDKDKDPEHKSQSRLADDEYNNIVDDIGKKMSFVKACFDTMYFLNEDKRKQ